MVNVSVITNEEFCGMLNDYGWINIREIPQSNVAVKITATYVTERYHNHYFMVVDFSEEKFCLEVLLSDKNGTEKKITCGSEKVLRRTLRKPACHFYDTAKARARKKVA